jgi:hypothetical protein
MGKKILTADAHKALLTVIEQLKTVKTEQLKPRNPGKQMKGIRSGEPLSENFEQWELGLRKTVDDIEEWCMGFTPELDPK